MLPAKHGRGPPLLSQKDRVRIRILIIKWLPWTIPPRQVSQFSAGLDITINVLICSRLLQCALCKLVYAQSLNHKNSIENNFYN